MKIGTDARTALRDAVFSHPKWNKEFRADYGRRFKADGVALSSANISRDDFFRIAEEFGLDIGAIVAKANQDGAAKETKTETKATETANGHSFRSYKQEEAANVFGKVETKAEIKQANGHDVAGDKAAQLLKLIAEMSSQTMDVEQVRALIKEELENHGAGTVRHVIELNRDGVKTGEVKGMHPKFRHLLIMAQARNGDGFVPGIFIPGPAGSGKTYAAKKVAATLELPFHFNGSISMAFELLGFIDANGCYHRTPFREAYENGGVYLFDEVDGSDNAAILALNAALANGVATFPDGQVTRHKDFIPMATANTWGLGATADYVGRAKLDGAFLDRFPCRLFWDYDNDLEIAISGDAAFAARVQRARQAARLAGLKVLITPRASMAGAALIAAGMTSDEAAECTYLANLTPEQRAMVE